MSLEGLCLRLRQRQGFTCLGLRALRGLDLTATVHLDLCEALQPSTLGSLPRGLGYQIRRAGRALIHPIALRVGLALDARLLVLVKARGALELALSRGRARHLLGDLADLPFDAGLTDVPQGFQGVTTLHGRGVVSGVRWRTQRGRTRLP